MEGPICKRIDQGFKRTQANTKIVEQRKRGERINGGIGGRVWRFYFWFYFASTIENANLGFQGLSKLSIDHVGQIKQARLLLLHCIYTLYRLYRPCRLCTTVYTVYTLNTSYDWFLPRPVATLITVPKQENTTGACQNQGTSVS